MQTQRSEGDIGPCSIIFCLILKTRSLWIWRQAGESSWFSCLHLSQHWGSKHTQSNQVGFCFLLFCFVFEIARIQTQFLMLAQQEILCLLFRTSCCLFWKLIHEVGCGQFIPFCCCIFFYCMIPHFAYPYKLVVCFLTSGLLLLWTFIRSQDWRSGVLSLLTSIHKVKCGVVCSPCFTFWGTAKPFSKETAPFFVPQAHFPPFTKHSFFSV